MSTLLTTRPAPRERDRFRVASARQERLFGDRDDTPAVAGSHEAVVAAPAHGSPAPQAPVAEPAPTPDPAAGSSPVATLDGAITSLWERLTAGAAAICPVCDGSLEVRHSAGHEVAGGRCSSCGSTLA